MSSHGEQASNHWHHPVFSSEPVTLLKSTFQAHASAFAPSEISGTSSSEAIDILRDHLTSLSPRNKRATHFMYAWRTVESQTTAHKSPRSKDGSATSSSQKTQPVISVGSSDGNESGAGERLLRLLELAKCENVIVVVYRWYGGVKLGSDRWKCISGTAKESLSKGGFIGPSAQDNNGTQGRRNKTDSDQRRKKK
ncbi:hypothetical protein NLI96_g6299 [Meripilus lineatus]|uniref:Impact N-terminal domain-containing protein n=1 Tax=Meripilus lineatus TaxID=2056292 RepID=A0AAD5V147_9APHY|nr:hypothetical protein NLI96_g6299 [Physisporinus lineatus]